MREGKCYIWKKTYKELPACANTKASVVEKRPIFVRLSTLESCENRTMKSVIYGKGQISNFLRVQTQRTVVLKNATNI